MNDKFSKIVLIIALIALVVSLVNIFLVIRLNGKVGDIDKKTTEISPLLTKFAELEPQLEVLKNLMPRLNQLLIAIPPAK